MVVGFNHNFRYKGELFHVQTEDGGLKSPQIITLLYRGGTILASKKTSYADIIKVGNLDQVVEDLMKEQHKEMLRRLKSGEFDAVISARVAAPLQSVSDPPLAAAVDGAPAAFPSPSPAPAAPKAPPAPPPPAPPAAGTRETVLDTSLDDIILSYLVGED